METMTEGPFTLKLYGEEEISGSISEEDPVVAILFFAICLLLGIASKHLLRGSKVPYTVALLVIGIALGSLEYGTGHKLGKVGAGIRLWAKINPDLLLAVFLPALLFESSFSMEVHHIKSCMVQMFLLAGPGVLISTFCLGSALKFAFPYDWSWKSSLLLGVILSATDPVAVVALLKELGARKNLTTVIEGESLMNDGLAVVLYQLFYQMILGRSFGFGAIVKYLIQVCTGSVGIGLAFGVASFVCLGFIYNDTIIEITLTLAVSYMAYFIAQDGGVASGILTVMTLGTLYSAVSRTAFKGDGQQSLHHFWGMVAYIANTLIFILSGAIIAEGVLSSKSYWKTHETSWGYLLLLYVFVQVIRVIVVGVLYPCLRYSGSGLNWKEATIVSWAGLRGPVSLSLALSVKRASDNTSFLSQDTGTLFVFFTGGIVFLTLIVNGSTTEFILHFLHMLSSDKLSNAKSRILDYTRYEMMNKALKAFGDLGNDDELGPSDWSTVRNHLHCLDTLEMKQVLPHTESESKKLDTLDLKDIRVRLLNGVQAAYCRMLEEGRISQPTAKLMMESVHESMDLVAHEALCDWNALKTHVHFPSYYRFLQMRLCPQKLVTYYMVEGLESGCYISAAFLRAHRIARRQLHDFLGESETVRVVLTESEVEGEEARKFLDDIHAICPQVLRVLKTRQMTYSILKQLSDHVQNLDKVGLLEEREIVFLNDAVQTDLKKLLRIPLSTKNPTVSDLLRAHPFSGALPGIVPGTNKELIQLHGAALYTEGSNPSGIWLVSNGLVESTNLRNMQSLDPTFSHGSTLGLYEVLTGKPYICGMITSSVVKCFFIEADHLLSLLRSDPMVEAFLWQESSIVVSKLLLPQVYEKISMQEMRALIVERSMMNLYMEGETVEIQAHSIGLLLDGSIRALQVPEEVISSPALLLPSQDTNCDQRSRYVIESRARVIVFDMEGHNREYIDLMRWPENFDGESEGTAISCKRSGEGVGPSNEFGAENDIVIRIDALNRGSSSS
ncbi:Son of sevenless 1 [Ranunculus cassubicifolius]